MSLLTPGSKRAPRRVLTTAAALVIAAAHVVAAPLFEAPFIALETAGQPRAVALADVDRDGCLDLVSAGMGRWYSPGYVCVFLGRGDGTFGAAIAHELPGGASRMAVADLDQDGHLDLVLTPRDLGGITLLFGDGTGRFAQETLPNGEWVGSPLAVADLNEDGKPDVLSVTPEKLILSLGTGERRFSDAEIGIRSIISFLVVDLDLDGHTDVVLNRGYRSISVLRGRGDGSFEPALVSPGRAAGAMVYGDLDSDGYTDLVVAHRGESAISFLRGSGDGRFETTPAVPLPGNPGELALGDTNEDGHLDVAVVLPTLEGGEKVAVLCGRGDGTFDPAVQFDAGSGPTGVAFGDVDADEHLDLVVANASASQLWLRLGDGRAGFGFQRELPQNGYPVHVACAELTADRIADLMVVDLPAERLRVWRGRGNGIFELAASLRTGSAPACAAAARLDDDARSDLVVANGGSYTVSTWAARGDGSFVATGVWPTIAYPTDLTTGDVTGDGRTDVVVSSIEAQSVAVLVGTGDGRFSAGAEMATGGVPADLQLADVDRDGWLDILLANSSLHAISIWRGRGLGTFGSKENVDLEEEPIALAIGDFDLDGSPDAVVVCDSPPRLRTLLGNGDGTFRAHAEVPVGLTPRAIALADWNRDGKLDAAVLNGDARSVSVLLGGGDGTFGSRFDAGAGRKPVALAAGDVSGDGLVDLVVANYEGMSVSILLNASRTTPIEIRDFQAELVADQLVLGWSLGGDWPGEIAGIDVERAEDPAGPYARRNADRLEPAAIMRFEDAPLGSDRVWYRFALQNWDGSRSYSAPYEARTNARPLRTRLFSPTETADGAGVVIRFIVAEFTPRARLAIHDVRGRVLWSAAISPGQQQVVWDRGLPGGARAARGIYFVRLSTGAASISRRFALLHRQPGK